jgi:hypothetical protein
MLAAWAGVVVGVQHPDNVLVAISTADVLERTTGSILHVVLHGLVDGGAYTFSVQFTQLCVSDTRHVSPGGGSAGSETFDVALPPGIDPAEFNRAVLTVYDARGDLDQVLARRTLMFGPRHSIRDAEASENDSAEAPGTDNDNVSEDDWMGAEDTAPARHSDGSRGPYEIRECECGEQRTRLLHVTRHGGLQMEVQEMSRHLCCVQVQTFTFNDGVNVDDDAEEAGLNYNVHKHRARMAWRKYGAWFQTFDAVLVSDTTPMARPFLEEPLFTKPLFIWICNRFDYANHPGDSEFILAHTDMMEHGYFPDEDYYALMQKAATQPNVTILLSSGFESHYALHWRGVDWPGALKMYPTGLGNRPSLLTHLREQQLQIPGLYGGHTLDTPPPDEMLSQTVLVSDRGIISGSCPTSDGEIKFFYNNEANLRVPSLLTERGFSVYHGRYDSAEHAAKFKAMVRIPCNYMTTAFHQLLAAGVVMMVPSPSFLIELSHDKRFWWNWHWDVDDHRKLFQDSRSWSKELYAQRWLSEGGCPEQLSTFSPETMPFVYEYDDRHAGALVYFNSWDDLEEKLRVTDFDAVRERATQLSVILTAQTLDAWDRLLRPLRLLIAD